MLFPSSFGMMLILLTIINTPSTLGVPQPKPAPAEQEAASAEQLGSPCGTYQIIAARGTGEPQSGSHSYANLIKDVEATIPGGSNVEIQYPSTPEYFISTSTGAAAGASYLSSQLARCPNQKYVFVGYSKGAMVISQLMNRLPVPADKVVAVVLFGNPYHIADAPQNRCSGTGGNGVAASLRVFMPSEYVPITYDCCKQWDMVCQTMGLVEPHLAYGGSQDETNAAAFVISHLRSKLGWRGLNL